MAKTLADILRIHNIATVAEGKQEAITKFVELLFAPKRYWNIRNQMWKLELLKVWKIFEAKNN